MKDHIVIFFCYELVDIHCRSFENLSRLDADFFIVENKSANSSLLEQYFREQMIHKSIVGYIQFQENTANIGTFFVRDHISLLRQYRYVTFTDGDLVYDDPSSMKNEVWKSLEYSDVAVCGTGMKLDNLPTVEGSKNWILPDRIDTKRDYNEQRCGIHFLTLKSNNLHLVEDTRFIDHMLADRIKLHNKKWVKTIKNKAYHLTWDLYTPGNNYYEWKLGAGSQWNFNLNSDSYKRII